MARGKSYSTLGIAGMMQVVRLGVLLQLFLCFFDLALKLFEFCQQSPILLLDNICLGLQRTLLGGELLQDPNSVRELCGSCGLRLCRLDDLLHCLIHLRRQALQVLLHKRWKIRQRGLFRSQAKQLATPSNALGALGASAPCKAGTFLVLSSSFSEPH